MTSGGRVCEHNALCRGIKQLLDQESEEAAYGDHY